MHRGICTPYYEHERDLFHLGLVPVERVSEGKKRNRPRSVYELQYVTLETDCEHQEPRLCGAPVVSSTSDPVEASSVFS